jgi:hypothetical protein
MSITNIHPADELLALREEMKIMEAREQELKALFLAASPGDPIFQGAQAFVSIMSSNRETVDKNALIAELGREAIEPFIKKTSVRSVRVNSKE